MSDWKRYLESEAKTMQGELEKVVETVGQTRLRDASAHMLLSGGKRLRAIMPLMAAGAVGGEPTAARPWGLALEVVHNFTLIHDDIMDEDEIRRGRKTVHFVFGNATAINAGDVLFARAITLLKGIKTTPSKQLALYHELGTMVQRIGEGQQSDMDFEDRQDVTVDEYLHMIEGKTAWIFRSALWGGALVGGATDAVARKMGEVGRIAGLGFQIWDDYLGLMASEAELGKPVGSDIRNGKKTLMVLHFLEKASQEDKDTFFRIFDQPEATEAHIQSVKDLFTRTGTLAYVQGRCQEYVAQCESLMKGLPDNEHRANLQGLVRYMVTREK